MKILVTGSEGVVGSGLVERLNNYGHDVFTLDIKQSEKDKHFECDISSYAELNKIFHENKFDFVYNLAALFGRIRGEDRYEKMWQSNVVGTKNIIRFQEKYKFKLIHFSSSEIYGDFKGLMTEDVPEKHPLRQFNDYAMSKFVNEMQILNSAEQFGTESLRVRLFNLYGKEPYSKYRSVICKFIYNTLHNKPYTVYTDYYRTSLYIDDATEILSKIIDNFVPGEVYNIGGTEHHDIKTISDMILSYLGKNDDMVSYESFDLLTTRDKQVDCSKAYKALNFAPKINLKEGIPITIEWMKKYYNK